MKLDTKTIAEDRIQIGLRIKEAREEAGLSRTELGEKTGISGRAFDKLETGAQEVSTTRLKAIAAATDVELDWLLNGDENDQDEAVSSKGAVYADPVSENRQIKAREQTPIETALGLLRELDDLREDGYESCLRYSTWLIPKIEDALRKLEPSELLTVAQQRDIDPSTLPSVRDLDNLLIEDMHNGLAACSSVEQRILDTAIIGADPMDLPAEALEGFADHHKVKGDTFWENWSSVDVLLIAVREKLRDAALSNALPHDIREMIPSA